MTALYLTTKERVGPAPGVQMMQPRGTAGMSNWSSIDFSPDSTSLAGGVMLRVQNRNDALHGGIYLGEDFTTPLGPVLAARLANQFGVTLETDQGLAAVLMELLVLHADDARSDRWNRLRPSNGRYDVWLGERVASLPLVSGGGVALSTETFDTANSSTLGPVHTWTEYGPDDWTVSSNVAILNTTVANGECMAIANTDMPSSDNWCTAVITQATNINSGGGGPICRGSSSAQTGYHGRKVYGTNPKGVQAIKVVAGVVTGIGTSAGTATWSLGTGYTVRVSANGSTIKATNAQLSLSTTVTDTAITSGTRMGIQGWVQTGASRVTYNNVAAGTLEAFPFPTKGRNARGSQAFLVRGRF